MKKIRRQVILAISMLFLALVVCSAAAAADVSDDSTAVQANNQTADQLTDHNSTGNNSIQTNSSSKNSTNSSSNTVISGHVKRCSSGEPFTGVKITARKNGAVVASTTTKADGSYTLEFQSNSGVFTVTASSPGHNPSSKEVTVKSGSSGILQGSADFQLGMDNVYVSTAGSDTNGDGTFGNPYQTIRKGIAEVNANGTVHLADGTYQGPDNRGLTIDKNLIITGQSQAGTVIDAQGADRIFTINSGVNVTIQNLTLENGYSTGNGGAILGWGNLTVENSTFDNNTALGDCGAIWNDGNLAVNYSTFTNNNGGGYGGAIGLNGDLTVNDCTFTNNSAGMDGGAIVSGYGNISVNGSTFTDNHSSGYGGGAISFSGILNVNGCTFIGNTANNWGGAIFNHWATLNVHFSRFIGNTAPNGNAIFNLGGTVDATNNWWGSNAGPAGQVGGFGTINADPWIILKVDASPNGFDPASGSTITADLTYNSNGVDTSAQGHVPDGIEATFSSTPSGQVSPTSDTTVNGKAETTFIPPVSGEVTVHTTVDGETVDTTLGGEYDVYVSDTRGNDATGDGSYASPYKTVRKGVSAVHDSGRVHIENGTYQGPDNRSITLDKNLALIGQSQAGTVIDAQGNGIIFTIPFTFPDKTVTLYNLTLTNGNASNGGAIYNYGILTVKDCTFTSNTATGSLGGGAIYSDGTLNIDSSTFMNNTAESGGAVYNWGYFLTVKNSTFTDNKAISFFPTGGGAIFNYASPSTVVNSTFRGNTADYGGAIFNYLTSPLTVENSTFKGNIANEDGGAIWNEASLAVTGSNFINNTANNGGAIWNYGGDASSRIVHLNRIVGNSPNNSEIYSEDGTVNATLNWWGSNTSPAGKVQGNVLCDPWFVLTITADPTTINNGGTSQVTADLVHDNTGTYHDPALGHVPDGIQIELTVPWGSFTNPVITHSVTLDTLNGSVKSTFYANEGSTPSPNSVPVRATADGYTTSDAESAHINILSAANLSITKTSSPAPVIAGNSLAYTVTITNNGPASAEGVTLDDVIDNIGAFKAGTLQYRYKVNDGTWSDWFSFSGPLHLDLGTILNGKTAVIEMNGIIDPSTPKNTVINNTATANTITTLGPKVATSITTVDTQANLVVTKTGPTTVTAGNQLTYTVTVTNNGPSDAQNVVIHDTIPAVLQDVTHDSFDLGTISAGQTKTVTITGKVPSSTAQGTVIENSATVTSDTSGTITPSGTVSTTVNTQAALAVTKTGLNDVTAGKTYTGLYTINVTNNGPSDAQNVVVNDTLPFNVVGGSYTVNGGLPVSFSSNSLSVDLGTLAPGVTSTIVINGEVASSTPEGIVSDTANVHTSTGPTYDFASNQVSTTVSVQSVLDVVKESLIGQVVAGVTYIDPIYRITVTNNGPSDARDVQVTDNIPAQIVNREYRVNGGVWTSFSGPLNAFVSYIARGVSDVIEVRGSIPSSTQEGSMSNKASASVYGVTFNSSTVSTSIKRIADVDLTSTVDNERPDVGDMVTFKVKVCNNGPSDATNIQIWDKLPYGFANVHISGSKGTYANGIWTLDLASGEEATLTLKGEVTPYLTGKTTTNTAVKIHQAEEDLDAHDSTSVSIYVPKSDLYIWMAANNYNPDVGGTVILAVKLGNKGPDEAKNVSVIMPLPDGFKFLGAEGDGNWIYDPITETLIWNLKSVPVGDPYLYIAGKIVSPGDLDFEAFTISKTYNANTQGLSQLSLHTNIPGLELLTLHVESQAGTDPTVKAARTTGIDPTGIPLTGFIVAVLMVLSGLTIQRKK